MRRIFLLPRTDMTHRTALPFLALVLVACGAHPSERVGDAAQGLGGGGGSVPVWHDCGNSWGNTTTMAGWTGSISTFCYDLDQDERFDHPPAVIGTAEPGQPTSITYDATDSILVKIWHCAPGHDVPASTCDLVWSFDARNLPGMTWTVDTAYPLTPAGSWCAPDAGSCTYVLPAGDSLVGQVAKVGSCSSFFVQVHAQGTD